MSVTCGTCDKRFASEAALRVHMGSPWVHKGGSKTGVVGTDTAAFPALSSSCQTSGKDVVAKAAPNDTTAPSQANNWVRIIKKQSSMGSSTDWVRVAKKKKQVRCSVCNKICKDENGLRMHLWNLQGSHDKKVASEVIVAVDAADVDTAAQVQTSTPDISYADVVRSGSEANTGLRFSPV